MTGALVPHAPLLLPEVTSRAEELRDLWGGLSKVQVPEQALVVVVTPHAPTLGLYENASGSLAGFGLPDVTFETDTGPLELFDLPNIDASLDHGALVPLALLGITSPVVVIGAPSEPEVSTVVSAIRDVALRRDLFVLASTHTSARLNERAPLPYSSEALRLETRLLTEIETDCHAARVYARELDVVGDSCSGAPLEVFGSLFAGAHGNLLAYGAPFGVGYPVVTAEIDVDVDV